MSIVYSPSDNSWIDEDTGMPVPAPSGSLDLGTAYSQNPNAPVYTPPQGAAQAGDARSVAPPGTAPLINPSGSALGTNGAKNSVFGLSSTDIPSLDDIASKLGISKGTLLILLGLGVLMLAIMTERR